MKVYGAINKRGEKWYTRMGKVFDAIGNRQMDYNWLITDADCPRCEAINVRLGDRGWCWLTGEELTRIVRENDVQWIWAVLSGFEKNVVPEEVLRHPMPYADGYSGFWQLPPSIQHPLASIEIVPWDSSLTLLFSRDEQTVRAFRRAFPESEDVTAYIEDIARTRE